MTQCLRASGSGPENASGKAGNGEAYLLSATVSIKVGSGQIHPLLIVEIAQIHSGSTATSKAMDERSDRHSMLLNHELDSRESIPVADGIATFRAKRVAIFR